ncbi:MAG TPA: hypothetical protein VJI52_06505 [Candidatus Nanoarchaeia archaeon]|nr:hypothetical protein [Candidatus Nanoarchaeia archaeon]
MSLIALIDKHRADLAVSWEAGSQEVVDKYRAFGSELVQLPSFTYSRDDMRVAVAHMLDLGFNRHARYDVAIYAMRRSALEAVPDVAARQEIFGLMSLVVLELRKGSDSKRLQEAAKDYVRKVGKSRAVEYLLRAQKGFDGVSIEVNAACDMANKADPVSGETAENHGQHIALEKIQLNDILEIIKSL